MQAARATCSQFQGYDPKASDDAFMWHMEIRKRGGETKGENGSKVKRQINYRRSGATQSPLTCALSIISLEVGSSTLARNLREQDSVSWQNALLKTYWILFQYGAVAAVLSVLD